MAIDLSTQLDHRAPAAAPILADLQGNILKGHGRDHTLQLFLVIKPGPAAVKAAKTWIGKFAKSTVTTAKRQFAERDDFQQLGVSAGLFANLLISGAGYARLGVAAPPDPKFQAGMQASGAALNDPAVATWDEGFQKPIDLCVLLADDDVGNLSRTGQTIVAAVRKFANVVTGIRGDAIRNDDCESIEHFGYLDGRSQPLFTTEDVQHEKAKEPGPLLFDPAAPLRLVLVPDPLGKADVSFGSYLVFRKLEQNVKGFKQAEQALATALGLTGAARELAGAMAVGRFEDGTPVVLQNTDGLTTPVPNNFDYGADPNGLKCPFQGHIRKMNPRGGTQSLGATLEQERDHRIARRGITYGERCHQPKDDPPMEILPEKDVGLLFMCFQSDIANQFEFMQQSWANNPGFLKGGTGVDPVIGQGPSNPQPWPNPWGGPGTKPFLFQDFVTLKGGEYFFAPSMAALKKIGS